MRMDPVAEHRSSLPIPNAGLVQRALRETLATTIWLSLVLGGISALLAYALPRIQARFMQRQFIPPGVREFRNAVLGIEAESRSVADVAFSIALVHPIVIALVAAHAIIVCTRILASEVERGTVDVLLALPVTRFQLFVSETVAWLGTAVVLMASVHVGCFVGSRFILPEYRPDFGNLAMVIGNLALVYLVIGASGMLAAVLTDRRLWAVLAVLLLTIFTVLINFLYTLDPALEFTKALRPLSLLEYYKPGPILRDGTLPLGNFAILGAAAAGMWTLAAIVLSRRDVTTL